MDCSRLLVSRTRNPISMLFLLRDLSYLSTMMIQGGYRSGSRDLIKILIMLRSLLVRQGMWGLQAERRLELKRQKTGSKGREAEVTDLKIAMILGEFKLATFRITSQGDKERSQMRKWRLNNQYQAHQIFLISLGMKGWYWEARHLLMVRKYRIMLTGMLQLCP